MILGDDIIYEYTASELASVKAELTRGCCTRWITDRFSRPMRHNHKQTRLQEMSDMRARPRQTEHTGADNIQGGPSEPFINEHSFMGALKHFGLPFVAHLVIGRQPGEALHQYEVGVLRTLTPIS